VIGLVLGGIATGLLIAEGLARLAWRPPESVAARAPVAALPELTSAARLVTPGARGIYNGAFYRANTFGFRGPDYERPKPPDVIRIVAAGDSVTMGSGVSEDEAYPHLLEDALNGRHDGHRYEVINAGMIGFDIHGVVARLKLALLLFDADFVIYGCTLNDILGPLYRKSMGPLSRFQQLQRYERFSQSPSYLLRLLWPHWESLRDLLRPRAGTVLYELDDNYRHNPAAWASFQSGLDHLARVAAGHDLHALVFIHASLEYLNLFHPYRGIYDQIARAAEARGLRTIQAFPALRGHEETSLWVSRIDAHPNAAAHRLMAEALVTGLDQLPPGYLRKVSESERPATAPVPGSAPRASPAASGGRGGGS
jgi:lysophospholipase L1-like esterase